MGGAVSDVTGALGDAIDNVGQGLSQSFEKTGGFIGGSGGILGQIEGGITDTVGNVSDALANIDDAIPKEAKIAAAIYLASQGMPTGAESGALANLGATDMSLGAAGAANAGAAGSALGASTYNQVLSQLTQYPTTIAPAENSFLSGMTAENAVSGAGVAGTGISSGVGSSLLGGGMNLSDFSSALNIASSVNSLTGGGVSSLLGGPGSISGSQAQQMADPFAPYRANLGQMYSGALQPGTGIDITKMPGYEQYTTGVLNPAMEASKRSAAASGLMYSGRESAALQDIGQRGYYGFMTDYLNRLAQGSGATQNPATAGGLGINQNTANQQAFSQGLGGLGQGIAGLYGSGNTQQYSPQQFQQQQAFYYGSGNAGFD